MNQGESSSSTQNSEIDDPLMSEINLMEATELTGKDKILATSPGALVARKKQELESSRDFPLFVKKNLLPFTTPVLEKPRQDSVGQSTFVSIGDMTALSATQSLSSVVVSPFTSAPPLLLEVSAPAVQVEELLPEQPCPDHLQTVALAVAVATPLPHFPISEKDLQHQSDAIVQVQQMSSASSKAQSQEQDCSKILESSVFKDNYKLQSRSAEVEHVTQNETATTHQIDIKTMLNLILEEIRDMKKSQQIETAALQLQWGKIEEAVASFSRG